MKSSSLRALFLLAVVLALALPGATLAQHAPPPSPTPPVTIPYAPPGSNGPETPLTADGAEGRPLALPRAPASPAAAGAADISLGQPGTSFRYLKTFGETETAYLEDSSHFYDAEGIATDGNNLWVTDSWGSRVVKFDNSGGFLQKIGKPGFRDSSGASLDYVGDVAVDAGGNIWVVDGGANHVVKYDATGKKLSELGQAWSAGSDNGHFDSPISIAFDAGGNIYVSDSGLWGDYGNQRVQVFDSSGNYLATIGQTGVAGSDNNHFRRPRHIAVIGNQLYVADTGNHRVQIFDISNPTVASYVGTLGTTGASGSDNSHFNSPDGVGVDASFIYVADSNNQRVQIFNRSTRAYVATIGAGMYGTDNNHFNHPTDVAIDAVGNIYIADNWNKRVQQYSSSRVYQRTYGTTGVSYTTDAYHYYFPNGVAVGKDGSIYIVENRGHRLVKLDANGAAQWTIGQPGQGGDDLEHLCWPQDVTVDSQGRVYLAQNGCDTRVRIFDADGAFYAYLGTGWGASNDQFNGPQGLTIDNGGNILVADSGNHRVQIFGPNRAYIATLGQTGVAGSDNAHFNNPTDVAVDGSGTIYVADEGNDRVQVFDSSRQYVRTIGGGGTGSDFGHFDGWGPQRLAVDIRNRLYVADSGNNRVQVLDAAGAYLTTVGGSWGPRTGQMRGPHGLAIGPDGALYVADDDNDRVQKFALGVPGWKQVNINGWGAPINSWISSLLPFQGSLYATGFPARVWRMTAAGAWSQVNADSFGDATNQEIDALAEFNGFLYAFTYSMPNGPQIWRSPDGSAWQNVTLAGGVGSGDRYVASFAVFDGQLYAGLGVGYTDGAEIWRTADGLTWTRVAANGFANDVYTTDVSSLVSYNGSMYAGTRHGDYRSGDGHADGPLGGEIWRSGDGTNWTRVNAPGFGNLEAYRIESLLIYQNALYAYVSHWGGTADGAEVWRCTRTVCAGQGDWTQVAANGFGVAQNQFLYAGAVLDNNLYAAAYNDTTGVQLWRTANGTDWQKATSYDGLGNSNNYYVYRHGMTEFNHRLAIGLDNWASGASVWMNSVTADFTATPTRGAPPLAVQFTNTSVGDYTTSLWDFGDGATSTETNPTHTYAQAGKYMVKLTVSDGLDSDTVTREAAVRVGYTLYLPLVARNWDPFLYDDFNDSQWNGAWNTAKWSQGWDPALFQVRQQGGALTFSSGAGLSAGSGATLQMRGPSERNLKQLQSYEGKLKISSDHRGGFGSVQLFVPSYSLSGHGWFVQCKLGAGSDRKPFTACDVVTNIGEDYTSEWWTDTFPAQYDTWYTMRIEADPATAHLRFYRNGQLFGEYTPKDAAALVTAPNLRAQVSVWNGDANVVMTRYVDDVRITPAK
jgi:DNA-binding beta-propeller fold protein YncE